MRDFLIMNVIAIFILVFEALATVESKSICNMAEGVSRRVNLEMQYVCLFHLKQWMSTARPSPL